MGWFIFWVILALVAGYGSWQYLYQGKIVIGPRMSERAVIVNELGNLIVLGPGTHFLPPGWKEMQRLDTNRDPISVKEEEVKSSNGGLFTLELSFASLIGRRFNRKNGVLRKPPSQRIEEDQQEIDPELIKDVVTRLQFSKGEEKAETLRLLRKAVEATISEYTDDELLLAKDNKPAVPRNWKPEEQWMIDEGHIREIKNAQNDQQFYDHIADLIELRANFLLRDVGINVVSVQIIQPPKFVDKESQKAVESALRAAKLNKFRAADDLSKAQTLSANTPEFGDVCIGEGYQAIGKGVAEAGTNFGKAFGEALGKALKGGS